MKYCKRCVIPDTRPGIRFNEEGVCYACLNAERKKKTDWKTRQEELKALCDRYRRTDGSYDCIVTVSGGKDSHFQVYVMKKLMKMNPLLLNVYNLSWTKTGLYNFDNMSETFGCDTISLHLNRKIARKMIYKAFVKLLNPDWYFDRAIYAFPIQMGIKLNIPLIVYGENVSVEYGGYQTKETYSAKEQINNDVVKDVGDFNFWYDKDITKYDLNTCVYPTKEEVEKAKLEPIYLSYFYPWNGQYNSEIARKCGFKTLDDTKEWDRLGCGQNFRQIDTVGYMIGAWLKYPKFGHGMVTDNCSLSIRGGHMTRKEAIKCVKKEDHIADPVALKDFVDFIGLTKKEFWAIVEKWYNKDLFRKAGGKWVLKDPIWKQG